MIKEALGVIIMGVVLLPLLYVFCKSWKERLNRDYAYYIQFHKKGLKKSQLPFIKVKIGNKYRYFLVDSGCNTNLIDKNFIQECPELANCKVDNYRGEFMTAIEKEVIKTSSYDISIKVSNEKIDSIRFRDIDLGAIVKRTKDESNIKVAGILGSNFFNKMRWIIDFEKEVIWVRKKKN